MKLYFKYFSMQVKSMLEYKKTFILSSLSQFATSIFSFLSIIFLFDKFGNIDGYAFEDILICFVMSFLGFSVAECFFRGFDHFDRIIGNGQFDRMLVRPRNLILQVLRKPDRICKIWKGISRFYYIYMFTNIPSRVTSSRKISCFNIDDVRNYYHIFKLICTKSGNYIFYYTGVGSYEYLYRWSKRTSTISTKYLSKVGERLFYFYSTNCIS